jgi:signal transduction histidine kinase
MLKIIKSGSRFMAHRPIYRVLGETSLELKCLTLFGAFLLVVISVSFLSYWYVTETVVKEQNPLMGQAFAERAMLVTHWEKLESDTHSPDFERIVQSLQESFRKQTFANDNETECRIIVPDPEAPGENLPRDDFEKKEVLRKFLKADVAELAKRNRHEYAERFNKTSYDYYQSFRCKPNCATFFCHRQETPVGDPKGPSLGRTKPGGGPWQEGDLMGIVHVKIPNKPIQAQVRWYWNALLAVAIVTAFLAMIAFYITIRYLIVRPLRHLHDVSDAISHGNIALRASIRTGDEFESLGVAFNRMLRHLVTIQDELRQVNTDLDAKVDQLAQLNMHLYEMNRIKSDFLATMSHELRTPLNSILGFSDVLGSIDSLDDKQKRYVQNIQKSGRMLLDMINNILDLAKIESGKMDVRLTEFSIEQVVLAQCDMARPLTEKKNIDLETDIAPGLPLLEQDQARVQQIINNLLSNAIKFTPEGGRIMVAAHRADNGDLLIRIIDTGVGIAAEDQQIIFEKFRQGKTALPGGDAMTREYSGTGLGLSIVKELCRLLEGEVTVQSELGTGSAFTVRLPWKLEKRPRLDSPLASSYEQFAHSRLGVAPDGLAETPPATGNGDRSS